MNDETGTRKLEMGRTAERNVSLRPVERLLGNVAQSRAYITDYTQTRRKIEEIQQC